jgi:hypothetical protein
VFTGSPGKYVSLKDTIAGFKGILAGDYDTIPSRRFTWLAASTKPLRKPRTCTALRADDVNEAAALQAIQDANDAMTNKDAEFEYSRAAAQLAEAAAQLRALRQLRK